MSAAKAAALLVVQEKKAAVKTANTNLKLATANLKKAKKSGVQADIDSA